MAISINARGYRFVCHECGEGFDEPEIVQEDRGEFWGMPAFETMWYCPCCGGEDFEEQAVGMEDEPDGYWVSASDQHGNLFGASIDAKDADELFSKFAQQFPDCEIADYGKY